VLLKPLHSSLSRLESCFAVLLPTFTGIAVRQLHVMVRHFGPCFFSITEPTHAMIEKHRLCMMSNFRPTLAHRWRRCLQA